MSSAALVELSHMGAACRPCQLSPLRLLARAFSASSRTLSGDEDAHPSLPAEPPVIRSVVATE